MNRSERRALNKRLRSHGISEEAIARYIEMQKMKEDPMSAKKLPEGQRIKLDYNKITSSPDYIRDKNSTELQVVRYHEFVETHKDMVMTVQHDKNHENHPWLVTLLEDESEIDYKLLFWVGHLITIDE